MKRFWKEARAVERQDGWAVELDGKPVRTPARQPLHVPTGALAQAVADEWNAIEEKLDPRAMPLTGLANAAIDRVAPDPQSFARGIAQYGESDLACYRAEAPRELVGRQEEKWDALLAWGQRRFDVDFATTCGVMHVEQPGATVERLTHAVAYFDPFRLAALSPLVTIGGSLLAALAVAEEALSAREAWDAVTVDDKWQLEQWGSDAEAEERLENRRQDFFAAATFLKLLDD